MAQSIRLAYPVRLDPQARGAVLVSFPDIPEALTEGRQSAQLWRKQKTASLPRWEDTSMTGATFRGPRRGAGDRSSHYRH